MEYNRNTFIDYLILFLSTLFFLHGSSFIAFHTPAYIWASIVIILFLLLVFSCSKTTNLLTYLLPISIIDIIWKICRSSSILEPIAFAQFISNVMQFAILPLITCYIFNKNNIKSLHYIFLVYCFVELTTGISTIMACSIDPTLARMDYGALRESNPTLYAYRMNLNVGDYHTSYGFTSMLPIAIMFYKWSNIFYNPFKIKALSLLACIIMIYTVYSASYTMSLAVCGLMMLIFLCPSKMNKSYFFISIIIVLLVAYLIRFLIPIFIYGFADFLDNDVMSVRLNDLADSLTYGENISDETSDFNLRLLLYEKSWISFLSNPILGSLDYNQVGGHSYILDNLGLMGLLGLGLMLNMWRIIYNRYIKIYKDYHWFYYYWYAFIAIFIFYCVNPAGMSEQLLFFYPISGLILSNYSNKLSQ